MTSLTFMDRDSGEVFTRAQIRRRIGTDGEFGVVLLTHSNQTVRLSVSLSRFLAAWAKAQSREGLGPEGCVL